MSTYYDFMVEAKYKDKRKAAASIPCNLLPQLCWPIGKPDRWRMEDRF